MKTQNCEACGTALPARTGRGRPRRFCGQACRHRARRSREQTAAEDRQAAKVAATRASLLALLDNVNPLPDEPALCPGGYEWQRFAAPLLTVREARLYRRLWREAATPYERLRADLGHDVPVAPHLLQDAAHKVALVLTNPRAMSTPPALRIHPDLIGDSGMFMSRAEADGFPVDGSPMIGATPYGAPEGYYLDDGARYEAQTYEEWLANGRRLRQVTGKVRLRSGANAGLE